MPKKLSQIFKKNDIKDEETPEEVVDEKTEPEEEKESGARTFVFLSSYGEILDLAMHLKFVEKQEVIMVIPNGNYEKIGDGIIEKEKNWFDCIGKGYIWVVDGCENARLQDWLREQGEAVVGSDEMMSEYEEDRQMGQEWFKDAGFYQPLSKNFTDIDECLAFIKENSDKRWILKQNGDAPKSLNHKGKFEANEDMIFHLEELKKGWNDQEYGKFDCDLMEIVDGLEVAASAFWNGKEYLKNSKGKVVGFLNYEEKKEGNGDTGETTGEMGTTFIGVTEDTKMFKDIMLKPKIVEMLKKSNFRGVFDINCIVTPQGIVALEPTSRFGIPATSYEFMEGLESKAGDLLESMARGLDEAVEIYEDWGMVMVIAAKPFPLEADVADEATSIGEKLWIMDGGKPSKEFSAEQRKHIHLENFEKSDEGDYKVATKNGYLLTVTGRGDDLDKVRKELIKYIKENVYISGMKYRTDIGERLKKYM